MGAALMRAEAARVMEFDKPKEPLPADPWEFLTKCFYTYDERAAEKKTEVVRQFPAKEYLRTITAEWVRWPNLQVDKSSQIMVTWLFVGLYLHLVLTQRAARVAWFCKTRPEARKHIEERMYRAFLKIPSRFAVPLVKLTDDGLKVYHDGEDTLPTSWITPMAAETDAADEAAKQMRSMTWTKVFFDEDEMARKAREIMVSLAPRAGGVTGVSTSNGVTYPYLLGFAKNVDSTNPLILDPKTLPGYCEPMKGIQAWNNNGFRYLVVNYRSDPDKDPETEKGRAWYVAERSRQPSDRAWRREMENDHSVAAGLPVYEHTERIILKPQVYRPWLPLLRWWDFGFANPFCCFAQIEEPTQENKLTELRLHLLLEVRQSGITVESFARHYVLEKTAEMFPGANCLDYGDPAAKQVNDKSSMTSEQMLAALGIRLRTMPSKINTGVDLFQSLISSGCVESDPVGCARLNREIGGTYHRDEQGVPVKDGVNDHGPDGVRYGVLNCVRYEPAGRDRKFAIRYATAGAAWTPGAAASRETTGA